MGVERLLARARSSAGFSQQELAARGHTSRPTLSAYEHGRKSPTLETASRLLAETGYELAIQPMITFTEQTTTRGRKVAVPSALPRLAADNALAIVSLPLHLNWSQPGRRFDLRQRRDRARVYEIVLREGVPDDVLSYVDGVLLIDLWDELVLPADVRSAWQQLVTPLEPAAA